MTNPSGESARTPDGPGPGCIHPHPGPDHLRAVLRTTQGPHQDQDHETNEELDDWGQRLRAAVAETLRKRATRRQQRQDLNTARAIGLQRRHRSKTHREDQS